MRLGVFHPAFETVGGAELLAVSQLDHFRSQGVLPEVLTLGYDAARWSQRLQGFPLSVVPKRHWSDVFFAWSRLAKLRRRGQRAASAMQGFDVVIAHNFPASAMLGAAELSARKIWQCNEPPRGIHMAEANPVLASRVAGTGGTAQDEATCRFARNLAEHRQELARNSTNRARRTYDLDAVARLDLIYAISEFSRDNARRIYGRCRDEVIYPIVRFPEGGRKRAGLDRSVRRVLVHSRLEVLKNIDTVIRGFKLFQASSPVACELHVVGDGPFRDRLEALASAECRPGTVRFHGYLPAEDLQAVYEACDVFALLTLDEPFGMVYPEAAAKGLLLIGPDHGGPLEILDGGRLGWVVDAFSPTALAEALASVWSLDDAEVDRRLEEVDRACRSRFGLQAVGPQLMALLEKD